MEIENLVGIESDARGLRIRLGIMVSHGEPVVGDEYFAEELEALKRELSERYSLESLKDDPVVRAYRQFYWRIGVDPTKTRPSSEALVRRLLKGKWPKINPLVDAGNIASARFMVPIGLYDMDRFSPPLKLTISKGGEIFEPIGGGRETLPPGLPILVDSKGTVLHLYPHRDSRVTAIRDTTRRMLSLSAGVPGVSDDRLKGALEFLADLLRKIGWESSRVVIIG